MKNGSAKLKSLVKSQKRSVLNKVVDFFARSGYRAYMVGGCPRDMILGIEPVDIDIVVEGNALKAAGDLNRILKGRLQLHKEFNTACIITRTGSRIDLAGARTETYASPADLPDVFPATIKEDLGRRDFTINTMCISLKHSNFGEIYDPLAGINDVRKGLIRVLHDNSFIDDPTRIFRALRYKCRLGFRLESATEARMTDAVAKNMIGRLSGQRILNELRLIFQEKCHAQVLKDLVRYGIVKLPMTKLKMIDKMGSLKFHAFLAHTRFRKLPIPARDALIVREIERLGKTMTSLTRARHNHQVYQILTGLPPEIIRVIPVLKPALWRKVDVFQKTQCARPLITGKDLIKLGLKPGPLYKRLLAKAFQRQLDGKISAKNKNTTLEALKKHVK